MLTKHNSSNSWQIFKRIYFGVLYFFMASIISLRLFEDLIDFGQSFFLYLVVTLGLLGQSLLFIVFLLIKEFRSKSAWLHFLAVILFLIISFSVRIPTLHVAYSLNKAAMNILAEEILESKMIYEMSKCHESNCIQSVNDIAIQCYPQNDEEYIPLSCDEGRFYLEVLQEEGIDSTIFYQMSIKLLSLDLERFSVQNHYIVFVRDGLMDMYDGYLYLDSGPLPSENSEIWHLLKLGSITHIGDNWYEIKMYV